MPSIAIRGDPSGLSASSPSGRLSSASTQSPGGSREDLLRARRALRSAREQHALAWTESSSSSRSRQNMSATTSPPKRARSSCRYGRIAWTRSVRTARDRAARMSRSRPAPTHSRVARSLRWKTTTTRSGSSSSRRRLSSRAAERQMVERGVNGNCNREAGHECQPAPIAGPVHEHLRDHREHRRRGAVEHGGTEPTHEP